MLPLRAVMRHVVTLFMSLLLLMPSSALAAEQQPASAPVPDLLAPVRFVVPWQCGGPYASPVLAAMPEPPVNWYDVGSWFNWLGAQLYNRAARPAICAALATTQAVLNLAGTAINATVVYGVNTAWRLLWSVLDWLQHAYLGMWGLFEWLRLQAWNVYTSVLDLGDYLLSWIVAAGALVDLATWVLQRLGELLMSVAAALAWFGGLVASVGAGLVAAITNPHAPPEAATAGPIWDGINEAFQAFRDSSLGWVYWLVIGMIYVFVGVWVLRQFQHLND